MSTTKSSNQKLRQDKFDFQSHTHIYMNWVWYEYSDVDGLNGWTILVVLSWNRWFHKYICCSPEIGYLSMIGNVEVVN